MILSLSCFFFLVASNSHEHTITSCDCDCCCEDLEERLILMRKGEKECEKRRKVCAFRRTGRKRARGPDLLHQHPWNTTTEEKKLFMRQGSTRSSSRTSRWPGAPCAPCSSAQDGGCATRQGSDGTWCPCPCGASQGACGSPPPS